MSRTTPPRLGRWEWPAALLWSLALLAGSEASLCATTRNFNDPGRIAAVHAAYNDRVRKAARGTDAVLIDLERHFAARPDAESLFTDGIHLSPKGHRAAAALIERALLSPPH